MAKNAFGFWSNQSRLRYRQRWRPASGVDIDIRQTKRCGLPPPMTMIARGTVTQTRSVGLRSASGRHRHQLSAGGACWAAACPFGQRLVRCTTSAEYEDTMPTLKDRRSPTCRMESDRDKRANRQIGGANRQATEALSARADRHHIYFRATEDMLPKRLKCFDKQIDPSGNR